MARSSSATRTPRLQEPPASDFQNAATDESAPIIRHRQGSAKDYNTLSAASRRDTQMTSPSTRRTASTRSPPSPQSSSSQSLSASSESNRRRRRDGDGDDDDESPNCGTDAHDYAPAHSEAAPQSDERDAHPQHRASAQAGTESRNKKEKEETWWHRVSERYGSVELENKGSVARDHLALERTYLAWLRTSLSFASIGIAVTQLFRLNTSISSELPDLHSLRHVGKPLGATFIAIALLVLCIGFHRYFESQHYVIRGKFPASRGSILLVTFVAAALIVCSLVVILSVAPRAFER